MGYPKLSKELKKKYQRNNTKKIRKYSGNFSSNRHKELLESFTRAILTQYEQWLEEYGTPGRKKEVMLTKMKERNITGPLLELAQIRVNDLYEHQKLIGVLRNRWSTRSKHDLLKINSSPDKYWLSVAGGIISRSKQHERYADDAWLQPGGKQLLANYLTELYEKQEGKCAITKLPMQLAVGISKTNENRASPDRISSKKGYEPGNIQLTLWWVNQMKFHYSTKSFFKKIRLLYDGIGPLQPR